MSFDFLIIGGGAAGFFAAINAAEKNPNLKIGIIERGKDVLQKVNVEKTSCRKFEFRVEDAAM